MLGFIRSLIGGQYDELGMLRAHFLEVVNEHDILEDFQPWWVWVIVIRCMLSILFKVRVCLNEGLLEPNINVDRSL